MSDIKGRLVASIKLKDWPISDQSRGFFKLGLIAADLPISPLPLSVEAVNDRHFGSIKRGMCDNHR